ncbi:MAG: acetate kinase [Campylobacterales bacterium]|nr:acetate kinase [Campylobacterales bacterium]
MKILVLNVGSSSVKFKLFYGETLKVLASGIIEGIRESTGKVSFQKEEEIYHHTESLKDHTEALLSLMHLLTSHHIVDSFDSLDAVGHRVVHGGDKFWRPTLIASAVMEEIDALIELAPLHNPANLEGIRIVASIAPNVPQVAVFDTAFHHTMPSLAHRYALPSYYYDKLRVRRYGFHGTSHQYVARTTAGAMNRDINELNLITLHLGNGSSICAIEKGISIDTSMGMTPLEGLVMGTRSGDIDPGIIFYLHKEKNMSMDEIEHLLNHESGLQGIAGTNDMRQIEKKMDEGDEAARLAMNLFVYRILKYIGAYVAVLGKVDALIFTGGIGEHSVRVREMLCHRLSLFGIEIDSALNQQVALHHPRHISTSHSKIEIWVTPTDEERAIAKETLDLLKDTI